MIRYLQKSITSKILASFIGIYLVTYLLTAAVVFTGVRNTIINSETHALSQLAEAKADRLINAWREGGINLHAWSSLEIMNDLISGDVDKRVHLTLERLKTQYELGGDIYAFDVDGKLIASSGDMEMFGVFHAPADWMPPSADLSYVDKHDDPFDHRPVVALVHPISASFSPDYRIGFLVMTIPWDVVEHLALGGDAHTVLIGLSQPPKALAWDVPETALGALLGVSADQPTAVIDDVSYVLGRAQISTGMPEWTVLTLRKTDVAVRSVRKVAWELAILGLVLSVPIVFGVRWLAGKLTAPVVQLTDFVTGIATSEALDKRLEVSGQDELSVLAQSFNRMAQTLEFTAHERERFVKELEALNQTLELKVAQRTQELTQAFDELKSAQGHLVQSEKMASLGQLVAGVAHELNNPIAFIYANFPHLEEDAAQLFALVEKIRALQTDPDIIRQTDRLVDEAELEYLHQDILKIIKSGKDGASRVKEIVRSLRSFSRVDEGELKPVRLEDGIEDTLAILQHELRGRITVERDFGLDTPVTCFSGQINQVFMNVIFNAIQAQKGGGAIRIATRKQDQWAVVSIADTGTGISPDVIKRIFDPFFTTKKVGEGTGLGLSISYGIIERHGGKIDVQSQVGVGTTFEIRIPINPGVDRS